MKRYIAIAALLLAGCAKSPTPPADTGETAAATVSAPDTSAADTTSADTISDTSADTTVTEETYDSSGVQGTPTVTSDEFAWADAYRDMIYSDDLAYVPDMFSLYDMTGDSIPELILSAGDWHGAGAEIYTYDGTEVRQLASERYGETMTSFGSWGTMLYSPSGGFIVSSFMAMGELNMDIYRVKGDTIIHELNAFCYMGEDFSTDDPDDFAEIWEINGEECTSEEYDRALQPYSAYDLMPYGRHHAMNEDVLRRKFADEYDGYNAEKYRDISGYDEIVGRMREGILPPYQRVMLCSAGDGDAEQFTVDGHRYEYAEADNTFADLETQEYMDVADDLTAGVFAGDGGIYFVSAGHDGDGVRECVYSFDEGIWVMDNTHDIVDGRYYTDEFRSYMTETLLQFTVALAGMEG